MHKVFLESRLFTIPKLFTTVVCIKRTSCRNWRTLKGKRNDTCRETFGSIIGKRYQKMTLFVENAFHVSTREYYILSYMQVSHLHPLFGHNTTQKQMQVILGKTRKQVIFKHNIVLNEKAQACPCHFLGKRIKRFWTLKNIL